MTIFQHRAWRTRILAVCGCGVALLLARFLVLLFAARPDHAVFTALLSLTTPLVWLFQGLDVGQPRFGARLEFATLAAIGIVLVFAVWIAMRKERR